MNYIGLYDPLLLSIVLYSDLLHLKNIYNLVLKMHLRLVWHPEILLGTTKLGGQNQHKKFMETLILICKTTSFWLLFAFYFALLLSLKFGLSF